MSERTDLDKLAEEELLREAKRGASRAAVDGALAWQKCPLQPTNKRFLYNIIQYTINANKVKEIKKSELTKHHSGYSVKKMKSRHSPETRSKRRRNDNINVQNYREKQEAYKRKVKSKHGSQYMGQSSSM